MKFSLTICIDYTDIRYNEQMEDLLEKAYEKFVIRKEGSSKQRKRIKKSYDAEAELLEVRIVSFFMVLFT